MLSFASAAGVYDVEPDTSVELDSTIWWPSDYKISLLDLTQTESDTLTWIYEQLVDIWNDMRAGFEFVDEDIVAGNTLLSQIKSILDLSDSTLSYILQGVGQTNGYLQITNNKLADLIGTVGIGNGTLGRLETLFPNLFQLPVGDYFLNHQGNLQQATIAQPVWAYVNNGFMGLDHDLDTMIPYFKANPGNYYLDSSGLASAMNSNSGLVDVLRSGFMGLGSILRPTSGNYYLRPDGTVAEYSSTNLATIFSSGFMGLRSLFSGSETDNVYQGTSINNENESTVFTSTGLGPMLNTWLGDIQNDLGLLSYVFASPQDLELKSESADNMTAVGDSLLSGDSSSSVKVSDITDISQASTAIQSFGDTGVTPGQAFAQLGNSNLFRFFSAETAADLDTTTSTFSRDSGTQIVTNYYEDSRSEFFKIIAGEGNDG